MRHATIANMTDAFVGEHYLRFGRVTLTNFRNFRTARLSLPGTQAETILLWGANGAGKTNFLEALSLLGRGRGLRAARLADIQRHGTRGPWAVAARLQSGGSELDVGTGLLAEAGEVDCADGSVPNRRRVRIDGQEQSPAALARYLSVSWLTPRMDRIFLDSPGDRLRFFDRIVTGGFPDHNAALNAYDKAHRERMKILSDSAITQDEKWLAALEARMAENAIAIMAARRESLDELNAALAQFGTGDFPRPRLELGGPTKIDLDRGSALAAEDRFRATLSRVRRQEAREGRAAIGPKRADLEVYDAERNIPARLTSTGEQKALLISLFLAHIRFERRRRGASPIVLLDEVAAHLDLDRRGRLLGELRDAGAQVWMSATDEGIGVTNPTNLVSVHVVAGEIEPPLES